MSKLVRSLREVIYIARTMSVWGALLQVACIADAQFAACRHRQYSQRIHDAKNAWVQGFLRRRFATFIAEWEPEVSGARATDVEVNAAPIWVCWLQGEGNAPKRVVNLIENVKRHAGGHPVNVVDSESILSLVDVPEVVVEGFRNGDLRVQTFSDVARVWLLQKYGGVWLDASILLVRPIPEEVFQVDMWTAKNIQLDFPSAPGLVDIAVWQSYLVGSRRGGVAISFMRDFLAEYCGRYSGMIDYVLFNHVAKVARDCIPSIGDLADEVPSNNRLCESLSQYLLHGGVASDEARRMYLEGDDFFYKLSWREQYPLVGPDGTPTFAGEYLGKLL